MKKTTFTLSLFFAYFWLAAQCPMGDITFSMQGQVDSFQINYPGCKEISGSVRISGNNITNLLALSTLDSIEGCLQIIDNPILASLNGLENLTYVGKCTTLTGGNIFHTEGLEIRGNAELTSLAGLDRLKTVKNRVWITKNSAMIALNGLDSLSSVGTGTQGIGTSDPAPAASIMINENASLKSIDGFGSLDSVALLTIAENDSLVSLEGLENLRAIGWGLAIEKNNSLKNFSGLDNLQYIGGIWIYDNYSLENFQGLQNLKTIEGCIGLGEWFFPTFIVEQNFSLIDFSGLENLQEIVWGCDMTIEGNFSLQSLADLNGNINSLSNLRVMYNPYLSICGSLAVCNYLATGSPSVISDNAPGCNSVPEVESACMVSTEETFDAAPAIHCSPNPAGEFLEIQVDESEKWDITLYDLQGKQMFHQRVPGSQKIWVKNWPSGIYALRALSGKQVFSAKIVKQ